MAEQREADERENKILIPGVKRSVDILPTPAEPIANPFLPREDTRLERPAAPGHQAPASDDRTAAETLNGTGEASPSHP